MRGLSDRDIEAALREVLGPEAAVSRSTVSRICERIKAEFEAWRARDLSDIDLDYLYVDASHFKMHDGAVSEPVLAAYGITTAGQPVFLHLEGVSAESTDACVGFLEDMVFPAARRQRCLVHRAWNCLAKVSKVDHDAVRGDYWEIFAIGEDFAPASRPWPRPAAAPAASSQPGGGTTPARSPA